MRTRRCNDALKTRLEGMEAAALSPATMVHVPNLLTLLRILLVPTVLVLIHAREMAWAFAAFVLAGVTDLLDGAIARRFDARTKIGAVLDPLADKALLITVYVALNQVGMLPLWLVVLVVGRDAAIVGGALLLALLRRPVSRTPLAVSKLNTALQVVLAGWLLAVAGVGLPDFSLFGVPFSHGLIAATAGTTLLSAIGYGIRGARSLSDLKDLPAS